MDSQKFLGRSVAVAELVEEAAAVAVSDARILISGERGAGKTLLARVIHERSGRHERPIVPISCSLPEAILESELFGPSKAGDVRPDERPLLPARIVSTSSCDLYDRTLRQEFSDDLFYRLNVVHLVIPALRERREDVPILWEHFVQTLSVQHNVAPPELTTDAMGALQTHEWPGNVRELKTVAERIVLRHSGRAVAGPHVIAQLAGPRPEAAAAPAPLRLGATSVNHILPGRPTLWSGLRGRASRR